MNEEIFQLLRSNNPEDRKKAIREMAQVRDREVLRYLATIYKEDPDPEVRDLAVRAGKHVKKQLEAGDWMGDVVPNSASADDYPAAPAKPAKSTAEEMNATRARSLMDKAMDASVRGDYNTARKQAQQAFTLYPDLQNDPYYTNLAAEIMGMPVEEAVDALLSGAQVTPVAADKRKRKNDDGKAVKEVSWVDALIDVGVYGLVVAGTTFLSVMIVAGMFSNLFRTIAQMPMSGEDAMVMSMLAEFGTQFGFGIGLFYALIAGVSAMIAYMIWAGIIHFSSTTFLGGNGSFTLLLHNLLLPSAAQTLISVVISVVALLLVFSAFPTDPTVWENFATTGTGLEAVDASFGTFSFINLLNFAIAIGFIFWISKAIGDTYAFGTAKGCGSIFVSYFVMVAGACGCYFAVLSSLLPAMMTSY